MHVSAPPPRVWEGEGVEEGTSSIGLAGNKELTHLYVEGDLTDVVLDGDGHVIGARELDGVSEALDVPLRGQMHHVGTVVIVTAAEGDAGGGAVGGALRSKQLHRDVDISWGGGGEY